MDSQNTYSQNVNQLEAILKQMDQHDLSIDRLQDMVRDAKALLSTCTAQLFRIETDVRQELRSEDED